MILTSNQYYIVDRFTVQSYCGAKVESTGWKNADCSYLVLIHRAHSEISCRIFALDELFHLNRKLFLPSSHLMALLR